MSIGDYVLTGGELPALVVIDAIVRLLPGAISEASPGGDSFADGLLEHPQYTRPEEFAGIGRPSRSSCPATTARSTGGAGARRCDERSSGGPTSSTPPP